MGNRELWVQKTDMASDKHRRLTVEDYQNMVDLLRYQVFKGWLYFHVIYVLDNVYFRTQEQKYGYFFVGAASACTDFTFLIVARLLDSQDNLSLKSLKRELQHGLPTFNPEIQADINADLDQLAALIEGSRSIETQIRHMRNHQIAHISMDYIRVPDRFKSDPPVNMGEIQRFFRKTYLLLNSVAEHLGMEAYPFEERSLDVIRDTRAVLDLL